MRKSSRSGALGLVALLLAMLAASIVAARWYYSDRPLALSQPRVEFRITSGASVRTIAQTLGVAGIPVNPWAFEAAARLQGAAAKLRAGRYVVEQGITLEKLIEKLRVGDVLLERVTIPEGATFREMRNALAGVGELRHDSAQMSAADILRAVGATETHPEGLFAPETYLFDPGTSDIEIWRQAYRMQAKLLAQAWSERAPELPYKSPYEALIMASIIEKETGQPSERAMIGGVFVNRLKTGMLLQTDPTVIYGLGDSFDGNLRKRDLLRDAPYNSYTRAGLPPTPIALPGRASINAALNPAATNALYFVARGDGTSQFSGSLAEHNRAVDRYQKGIRQ